MHLDALLAGRAVDAFVVFSSIAGVWGSGGQGAYAAANAHLDALVERRRAAGLAGTAVAWGPWAEGGMADAEGVREHLRRRGLTAMEPGAGAAGPAAERWIGARAPWWSPTSTGSGSHPAFTSARPSACSASCQKPARARNRRRRHGTRGRREGRHPAPTGELPPADRRARHCWSWCVPSGRGARARRPERGRRRARLPRSRLRLAHRGRAAQPARRGDRAAAARDPGLRLPDAGCAGRVPA